MWFFVMCCVVLIIGIFFYYQCHDSNFPPGPRGLPILGNILDLLILLKRTGFFARVFSELAGTYGPIVGLRLGPATKFIVVSGREAVLEMLRQPEFDSRPDSFSYKFRTMGERRGIIFNDGPVCENNRRFALKHLKELGFGKKTMEDIILVNAFSLIQTIEKKAKHDLIEDITNISSIAILNNTWSFIAGSRFSEEDPKVREVLEMLDNNTKQSSLTWFVLDYLPFLRYIIPGYSGYSEFMERHSRIWKYFLDEILKHKITRINGVYRDLIDAYLGEIDAQKNESIPLLNEAELAALMKDFFAAGVETTNNSLGFVILYVAIRKDVQEKLYLEIDEKLRDSLPSLVSKCELPYMNAAIAEVLRISNIAPVTVNHRATTDSTLLGYEIKKDYILSANLASVHMDEKYWGDPEIFRPERFINERGEFVDDPWLIPFGAGRRKCIGYVLAKQSLLLFTICLLQKFTIELAPGENKPNLAIKDGFVAVPPKCKLLFKKR